MESNSTSKFSDSLTLRSVLDPPPSGTVCIRSLVSDLSMLGQQGGTSSSLSMDSHRYEVFISFRGPDVRNTFVDHLYTHLSRKGIFAFKDDERLQKGESLSPQLIRAIKQSRVSIVVFSKNYADSKWCLEEMATIAECRKEQTVFPVFYDVDPSHVRNQIGVYENAFVRHTESSERGPGKVDQWKRAMTVLGRLVGWDVRNKPELGQIEKIVQEVIKTLGHKFDGDFSDLIGIQPHVEALERLLKLNSEDDRFRVLGIWGMDGIGKTTLAKVLYDKISSEFHACCFIENVSKIYRDVGAIAVQKQILRQTIKEKNLEEFDPDKISGMVRNRLRNIKLLVVLDDVDDIEQLQKLHIDPKLLLTGSRIIITTRDEHILKEYEANAKYEAKLMNDIDAHKLLCKKAFKSDYSSSTYAELIPEVLKYAQCLPLAIIVMGSFLCSRNVTQWRATLARLRNNPPDKIIKVLQVGYEGLNEEEKEIFLHVACLFKGERKDYVSRILDACGLHPDIGIPVLAEKSLITIRNEEIHMHGLLEELGKQIVRGDHPDEPRFWNRLWRYQDFYSVMMTKRDGLEVKAIVLHQKEDGSKLNELRAEDLPKMRDLKLLILNHKNFSGRSMFLSNSLRYLSWSGYPFTSLSSEFQPCDLVELNMPDSSIEQLWEGVQDLPSLKRMDLSNSKNLKRITGFLCIYNLERLDLTGCTNLSKVDPSIGILTELVFLSLQNCSSLVSLNLGSESRLSSLKVLRLSGCTKLENTPDFTGALFLEYLDMDRCTGLSTIDESIGALAKLRFLSLRDCTNLVTMPDSFNDMTSLVTLDLCGCWNFRNLPVNSPLKSLIFLDLSFCRISEVPDAIGELRCLERLNLQGNKFTTLPSTIERLHNLAYLNLSHCHSLEHLPKLPTESGPSVGRYFKTTSGSRDHRSGLYIFDCLELARSWFKYAYLNEKVVIRFLRTWLIRLAAEPRHFRCGFDIVLPWPEQHVPKQLYRRFKGGSIIRVNNSNDMHVDWLGFVFCVAFEVNNRPVVSGSALPYPFYLSFESENTEERFDMPLSLEGNMVDGLEYLWTIYISREHCHFVKTGVQITFKARHGLKIKEWGLNQLTKEGLEDIEGTQSTHLPLLVIDNVETSSSNLGAKTQVPYNWYLSEEDEVENYEAKGKETNLSNLGLLTIDESIEDPQNPRFFSLGDDNLSNRRLSTMDEPIRAFTSLRLLSLRACTNLAPIPDSFNVMTSLVTLDLCGCWNFRNLPVNSPLKFLIFLDLSFCRISEVPDAIGELRCLERLNLQGNKFTTLPSTIERLHSLKYLNLSHCHSLEHLPKLPTESDPSVGRYFKSTCGSRDHRSGLYIFDCPEVARSWFKYAYLNEKVVIRFLSTWLIRLATEPRHFRCGFDIVLPWPEQHVPNQFYRRFKGGSIIRVNNSNDMHVDWLGFVFCVAFEVNNRPAVSGSPLPYPFYLSFESENTEECFDMPLSLEGNMVDGLEYLWTIYISREHCHFVKNGVQITFKARHGLKIKEWGLNQLTKEGLEDIEGTQSTHLPLLVIDNVETSSSNLGTKTQVPYNWSLSEEDEVENYEAKGKETNLSNLGLINRLADGRRC